MILPCTNPLCKHSVQDRLHGYKMRVHNQCNGLVKGKQDMARCTVCLSKTALPKEEREEPTNGK